MITDDTNIRQKGLSFKIGEESQPILEDLERVKNSFFIDQYKQALNIVEDIILSAENNKIRPKNNIITFTGDRGSGKTSCMLSFVNLLKKDENIPKDWDLKKVNRSKFFVMDSIDPSFMEEKDKNNVLELIIGRLFKLYEKERDRSEEKSRDMNQLFNIVENFIDVKKFLPNFKDEQDVSTEAIEQLTNLAAVDNLQKSIYKLIKKFLSIVDKDFLVISIDDIDLNITNAYRMVEQIRKFLILPNIIVVLAVKFEQLRNVITQQMLIQNDSLIKNGLLNSYHARLMAEKYLDKLMPMSYRIPLPNSESFLRVKVKIEDENVEIEEKVAFYDEVSEVVTSLIFEKTRYLFYNKPGEVSPIVPNNLRELRHLILMLYKMDKLDEMKSKVEYNKSLFRDYLFNSWIEKLSTRSIKIARSCLEEDRPSNLNKKVVLLLNNEFFSEKGTYTIEKEDELKDIVDVNNIPYNVSLGDAFRLMRRLENLTTDLDVRNLLFFIKSLYSIKLYDYYKIFTSDLEGDKEVDSLTSTKRKNKRDLLLNNFNKISLYRQLVGGSFFSYKSGELLPKSKKDNISIDKKMIDGEYLNMMVKFIVYDYNKDSSKYKTICDEDNNNNEIEPFNYDFKTTKLTKKDGINNVLGDIKIVNKFNEKAEVEVSRNILSISLMQMVEFFILCTKIRRRSPEDKKNYRLSDDIFYSRNSDVKYLEFDVTAPFFNIIDIEETYNHFSEEFFNIVSECKSSLYWYFMQNKGKEYFYGAYLRNSEIIEQIFDYTVFKRGTLAGKNEIEKIQSFYKNILDFYNTKDIVGPYFLNYLTEDKLFYNKSIFDLIFNPKIVEDYNKKIFENKKSMTPNSFIKKLEVVYGIWYEENKKPIDFKVKNLKKKRPSIKDWKIILKELVDNYGYPQK